jgi:hypothetical protein
MRPDARVLLFSQRAFNSQYYVPWIYEFEDVAAEIDAVDLLTPTAPPRSRLGKLGHMIENRGRIALGLYPDSGLPEVTIDRDYELFFAFLVFATDAAMLKQLKGLRERCRRAVCVLMEAWSSNIERDRTSLQVLQDLEFDRVYLTHRSALPELARTVRRPCDFFPFGIDCHRFTPYPKAPLRSVDCYSMGRRSDVTHRALVQLAEKNPHFFYIYDTVAKQGDAFRFTVSDWKEHRNLVAAMIKRTRYFIAYGPRFRNDGRLGQDDSLSPRLFEGAASGAVVLGIPPDCPEYVENFDWPDATIRIPFECEGIEDVLRELDSAPDRLAQARRLNMFHCLMRHDWVYRWEIILSAAGLATTPFMEQRRKRLQQAAEQVQSGDLDQWASDGLCPKTATELPRRRAR